MPHRNSKKQDQHAIILRRSPRFISNSNIIQVEPTTILRRSPRFLGINRYKSEDPKTPSNEKRISTLSSSESNSCISTPKEALKVSKTGNSKAPNLRRESNFGTERYVKQNKSSTRSAQKKSNCEGLSVPRRSSRLSGKKDIDSLIVPINLSSNEFPIFGKESTRVTRNSTRKAHNETGCNGTPHGLVDCSSADFSGKTGLYVKEDVIVVIGLSVHQSVDKTKKTGKSNQGKQQKPAKKCIRNKVDKLGEDSKAKSLDQGGSLNVTRKEMSSLEASNQLKMGNPGKATVDGVVERGARAVEKKQKCIGVKRKRNQVKEGCENHGSFCGWTNDQDLALQRAYFAVKPTPHFWKKVARMVPGKSAQECFDRIHADHITPLRQPQPRSRAKVLKSSPISFSASKLLDSIRPKSKRPKYAKTKSHLVHKTMRELMQKQCQVNRDQNADLFSILEPKASPSTNALQHGVNCCTPKQEKPKLLIRCQDISSARRHQSSLFNSLNRANLASPPVLKPVKNKALHEKYIDQLLAREAKRKAASARAANSKLKALDGKENHIHKNAIQTAKNALLLDARDAISQFQHVQSNDLSIFPDVDEDVLHSSEDID